MCVWVRSVCRVFMCVCTSVVVRVCEEKCGNGEEILDRSGSEGGGRAYTYRQKAYKDHLILRSSGHLLVNALKRRILLDICVAFLGTKKNQIYFPLRVQVYAFSA